MARPKPSFKLNADNFSPIMNFVTRKEEPQAAEEAALKQEPAQEVQPEQGAWASGNSAPKASGKGNATKRELPMGEELFLAMDDFLNPDLKEKKTQRLQLLLRPSLVRGMRELASQYGVSVNEIVTRFFEAMLAYESRKRGK